MYYITYATQPDWPTNMHSGQQVKREWNQSIRNLMKNYSLPCAKTSVGTRLRATYIMASSTTRYKI